MRRHLKDRIKVLHVVYRMSHGGIETFLMSMLRNYDREMFHMDILYTGQDEGKYAEEAKSLGADLIHCPLKYDQVRFIYKVNKILKEGCYKAVNNHLSDIGGGAILAAKLAGVPARVSSYHTNLLKRNWIKKMYMSTMRKITVHCATDITTSSPDVTESHFRGMRIPQGLVQSISYGVDVNHFARSSEVQPLQGFGPASGGLVVGHIGHYTPQKNHDALLKIASKIVQEQPGVRFLLRGDGGDLRKQVEGKIAKMGLSQYITQVQDLADIRQFYASIDVFILPSRHEGMPVSIIEAQAAAKPIVASRLKGIEIATADEMKKNLFAVDDIEPFSECLLDLLKNREKRLNLGKIGQNFVRKNLDISIAVGKYEKLYLPKIQERWQC